MTSIGGVRASGARASPGYVPRAARACPPAPLPVTLVQQTLSGDNLPTMRVARAVASATGQSTEALLTTPSTHHARLLPQPRP
jgi:hypothetical protein